MFSRFRVEKICWAKRASFGFVPPIFRKYHIAVVLSIPSLTTLSLSEVGGPVSR